MHIDKPVMQIQAQQQWQMLYETLLHLNVEVKLVEPVQGLPDMTFTANAGFIYQNQAWVSHFKSKERQAESTHLERWFSQEGFEIVNEGDFTKSPSFEGAGDALFFNDYLAAGYGFRSDISIYDQPFFKQFNVIFCELVNPYFYHLDTCFCPLNDSLALWYPDAFSQNSQKAMRKMGELIAVPEAEAKRFACNAVVVDQHVILPSGCPETYQLLKAQGFTVHSCEMGEYIKAGGACKCLTLRL